MFFKDFGLVEAQHFFKDFGLVKAQHFQTTIFQSCQSKAIAYWVLNEPHHEKTGFLPMRKQRRRSASR